MFVFPAGVVVPLFTRVILDVIVYLVVVLFDDWPEVDDILSELTISGTFTTGACSSVHGEGERSCTLRSALFAASSPVLVFNSAIYRQRFARSTFLCQRSGYLR
jgi:hypothetical protein